MIVNFKNLAENILIAFMFTLLGLFGGYISAISAAKNVLETQENIIKEAIAKETTSINHTFMTEIKKLKSKHGAEVDLKVAPESENRIEHQKKSKKQLRKERKQRKLVNQQ